jgi:hypothetical protein
LDAGATVFDVRLGIAVGGEHGKIMALACGRVNRIVPPPELELVAKPLRRDRVSEKLFQ